MDAGYDAPSMFAGVIERAVVETRGPVVRDPLAEFDRPGGREGPRTVVRSLRPMTEATRELVRRDGDVAHLSGGQNLVS